METTVFQYNDKSQNKIPLITHQIHTILIDQNTNFGFFYGEAIINHFSSKEFHENGQFS